MTTPIKLNPHDFEYLTQGDREYLAYIERLYLLNGGRLEHFRVLGPWHQVDSRELNKIVQRVASPTQRPCSRGHVKGLWCVQDPTYITGPKILKRPPSTGTASSSSTPRTPRTPKTPRKDQPPQTKVSIPRKYQIVPKPTPWIIMEPSKKKNFISDDPPDPSYRELTPRSPRTPRGSSPSKSRPSTTSTDVRYVGGPYQNVSGDELDDIVDRITRPTVASRGGIDLKEKFRNKDYVYGSRTCTPDLDHICKPTVASRGGVDIQEKFENKGYVYGSRSVTPDQLNGIVDRITKPTVASTGGAGKQRDYTDFVYGDQKVDPEELQDIVARITKPTVSSRGGIDLADKKFVYIKPAKIKTNIIIPGLETRYMGRKKVTSEEMEEIVERLNKLTPAYTAKYSINPHVWKDDSARTGPAHRRQVQVS